VQLDGALLQFAGTEPDLAVALEHGTLVVPGDLQRVVDAAQRGEHQYRH
jgi:hypothetical protein